jgi:2,4-dienoyl-CoA reductase-like NADH-dependent reductase (Old Yellow Enzyme family)
MQAALPQAKIVGAGFTWFRDFSPYIAAGVLKRGGASMVGYGRQIFAYPDFYKDIALHGKMFREKACVSCSICSYLKRDVGTCGCVVKDTKAYLPLYRETYSR